MLYNDQDLIDKYINLGNEQSNQNHYFHEEDNNYKRYDDQDQPNQGCYQNFYESQELQKMVPTGASAEDNQITYGNLQQHQQSFNYDIEIIPKIRLITAPQITQQKIDKRKTCLKGSSYQTQNIGKHLKKVTMTFLSMLSDGKFLDRHQTSSMLIFSDSNGSIKDFEELFNFEKIRKLCLEFYSSKNYIKFIMSSSKMDLKSKLIMIKYAEKLRSLTYTQIKGWKFAQ